MEVGFELLLLLKLKNVDFGLGSSEEMGFRGEEHVRSRSGIIMKNKVKWSNGY